MLKRLVVVCVLCLVVSACKDSSNEKNVSPDSGVHPSAMRDAGVFLEDAAQQLDDLARRLHEAPHARQAAEVLQEITAGYRRLRTKAKAWDEKYPALKGRTPGDFPRLEKEFTRYKNANVRLRKRLGEARKRFGKERAFDQELRKLHKLFGTPSLAR